MVFKAGYNSIIRIVIVINVFYAAVPIQQYLLVKIVLTSIVYSVYAGCPVHTFT